jgi:hypothetical protein
MVRVSTVALALACLVTGCALLGTWVNAVQDSSPARRFPSGINVGAHVMLQVAGQVVGPDTVDCTIARIDGGWFLCAPKEQPSAFTKPVETWYDIGHFVWVRRVATER